MRPLITLLLLLLAGTTLSAQRTEAIQKLRKQGVHWEGRSDHQVQLRFPASYPFARGNTKTAVNEFLQATTAIWGITDKRDFRPDRSSTGMDGRQYLRYQSFRDGVPVLGEQLTVQLSPGGKIKSLSGHLASSTDFARFEKLNIAPAAAPQLSLAELRVKAFSQLQPSYPFVHQWHVHDHGRVWTSANPWNPGPADKKRLTRALEISEPAGHRAEMVYLEATTGTLILRYPIHCSLDRVLYQSFVSGGNRLWNEGDAFPGNLEWEEEEMLQTTEEVYHLFHRTFNRLGFDGESGQMRQVVRARLSNCPNALARNNSVSHCTGVVSDDIVGHEWTHNYMREMNGIIYQFESGAISEGYADIFGEVIDLLNARGEDTDDNLPRSTCEDSGFRWKLGEDATAVDTIIRDLWQPECRNDPSARNSPDYACLGSNDDNGGVHINSGLVNRAFSLLTDGGILNNDTIAGIGMTKSLHIFYHAADKYLTPVTDFSALAQMLRQATHDLRGKPLTILTLADLPAPMTNDSVTAFDSLQVEKAIRATGLPSPSPCNILPTLAQAPPASCAAAPSPDFIPFLNVDWENGIPLGWSLSQTPVHPDTWVEKAWQISSELPDQRSGKGIWAPNSNSGDCRSAPDNGTSELTSPVMVAPPEQTDFLLRFNHYYAIQEYFDGGLLFYSVNGEEFSPVPNGAFLYNGYDAALEPAGNNDNPLAGMPAFQAADGNSTTGTWGTSIVDLSGLGVDAGDSFQLRWVLSYDGCEGWLGWFLDEITIGYCGEAVLPVAYQSFTATPRKDHIQLAWVTSQEENNAGFYVERRRADAVTFTELGFIAAGGDYVFDDYQAVPEQDYVYRLRQEDYDGSTAYSALVTARLRAAPSALRVFPNPVVDALHVISAGTEQLSLHDLSGRKILGAAAGAKEVVLAVEDLPAGVYLLRAGKLVRRIVVH